MPQGNEKNLNRGKITLALYNMIPNLIWSIINLTPVTIFCFTIVNPKTVYIFIVISLIPVFLRNSFIDKLQIGKTTAIYKKLGVPMINKLAQNGEIINALMKRKFPDHKVVRNREKSISGLISQTYLFEKFHLMFFLFFSLIIIYAIVNGNLSWAFIILLTNIGYNIYPNLLQQYIRLKLKLFRKVNQQ